METDPAQPAPADQTVPHRGPARTGVWLRERNTMQAHQDRIVEYVWAAVDARQDPTRDPWPVLGDVLDALDRIRCGPTVGPDGQDWAASAITDLAHLWLDTDQVDELYLTGTVQLAAAGQIADRAGR